MRTYRPRPIHVVCFIVGSTDCGKQLNMIRCNNGSTKSPTVVCLANICGGWRASNDTDTLIMKTQAMDKQKICLFPE